jgi:predicted lipoprotein with Yx(FWY)xxD motif
VNRLIVPGMAIAAALAVGACGGGGGGAGSNASSAAPARSSDAVSVERLANVGRVLVDPMGMPVYASDLEKSGKILCTGGCNAFWKPVTASAGKPTVGAGTGKVGVVMRPDGIRQLTANGRPLYTFTEDSPRRATGDGFTDDFDGRHFTWHVVHSGGTTTSAGGGASSTATGSSGVGGY